MCVVICVPSPCDVKVLGGGFLFLLQISERVYITLIFTKTPFTTLKGRVWHSFGHNLVLRLVFIGIATDYKSDRASQTHKEDVFD